MATWKRVCNINILIVFLFMTLQGKSQGWIKTMLLEVLNPHWNLKDNKIHQENSEAY